ncbi:MAG: hypothetical protein UW04_C0015G0007 [Parcubacteria group bacterium GW2011_GWB1_43_8]|nr:MAG: hypothetical protein UW04_C0015G0007 [Parcubacteria group bacterium GW2011_GWB1_43_8]
MNPGIAELLANPYVPRVLTGILGATFIFFAVVSVVLLYHWKRYESANSRTVFAAMLYFGGSIILFGGAAYYLFLFIK